MFRNFGWDVVILQARHRCMQEAFEEPGGERAARLDRHLPEPALFRADLPGRRRVAQAPARRSRRPGAGDAADREALRRGAGAAHDQSRRPRPAEPARSLREGARARPAGLLHRLYDQGLRPAARRPQGQPCRPADARRRWRLAQQTQGVRPGHEWDKFEGLEAARRPSSSASWPRCRSSSKGTRRYAAPQVPVPETLAVPGQSGHVDAAGLRPDPERARRAPTRRWPTASSPPRPT